MSVSKSPERLSDNPSESHGCHSEPFGRLRTGSAKRVIVILSSAKDLEILRLTPQNDVIGQALKGEFFEVFVVPSAYLP